MAKNTIKVKKYSDVIEEYVANATITPGMLVEVMTTNKLRAHATASGNALPMFALEDELQGKTIDDNYVATDQVQVWVPYRGDMVYGILKSGQNVTIGTFLVSNGDGKLKAWAQDVSVGDVKPTEIIGVATEVVNASGADARIIVRII
jgi:hypothetical protein